MDEIDWLAERFDQNRTHLRSVAYRMLGSLSEADDAVQETWLRLSRSDTTAVENLGGWLTTVTARVCLNRLRARRRVQGAAPAPDSDLARQREVVDAFFAAARGGDFDALVAVLDPDIILRSDGGPTRPGATTVVRGAANVARQALMFSQLSPFVRPALVNGAAGVVVVRDGRALSVMGFTVRGGRIVAIDALADPDRLGRLDLTILDP
jgi:ketosteroid isomerase-like protein